MATKALDARLSEPFNYITNGKRLLLVRHVRWIGTMPTRKRKVNSEDVVSLDIVTLTDGELEGFEFVCHGMTDQEISDWLRIEDLSNSPTVPVAA